LGPTHSPEMKSRALLSLPLGALGAFALAQAAFSATGTAPALAPLLELSHGPAAAASGAPGVPSELGARRLLPAANTLSAPATPRLPDRHRRPRGTLLARVRSGKRVAVRSRPGGPVAASLGSRTEFGSPRIFSVAKRRGRWLGVATAALPNGTLGWIDRRGGALDFGRTRYSLHVDLSRRRLELRRGHRVVERLSVAVGRPGSPTPTGRFAVTDKLSGPRFSPYYGCCVLALSGNQPNPPSGWRGGTRLAIHGTNAPGTVGTASSAGCLRAGDDELRVLMRRVRLGTPAFIRP
jgi:hypothetical protein